MFRVQTAFHTQGVVLMRLFTLMLTLIAALSLFSCSEINAPLEPGLSSPSEAPIGSLRGDDGTKPLPAFALPGELQEGGKGDAASDWKAAHPEWYAITEPPTKTNFRHMNEWEDMQSMLVVYPGWIAQSADLTRSFVDIIRYTTPVAKVWVVFYTATAKKKLTQELEKAGVDMAQVEWYFIKNDSIWTIDFGPLPLVDEDSQTVALLDWKYYANRYNDDAISTQIGQEIGATVFRDDLNVEGGNFQGDGEGNCYITNRGLANSGVSQEAFELSYKEYAACDKIHFLKDVSDDGTGHIDMLFKLYATDGAVLGYYPDELGDPINQKRMDDNEEILKAVALADGETMAVYRLPMPGWGKDDQGKSTGTPFTYINSTLINGRNLWPYTNLDKYPEWNASFMEAAAVWSDAMPDYEHIAIETESLNAMSGAIHCITRTFPNLPFEKWIPDGTCDDGTCTPAAGYEDIAYDGQCVGTAKNECFGPKWTKSDPFVDACEGYTYEGCSDGDVLTYCEDNVIKSGSCDAGECGWANGGWYDCKTTGGTDPSDTHPRTCAELLNTCKAECGDQVCGDDGCGGSCGTCTEEQDCTDTGQCEDIAPPCTDACTMDTMGCTEDEATLPWTCTLNETSGCYQVVTLEACGEGFVCATGACEETTTEPVTGSSGGGCAVSQTGNGTFLPSLVLGFALLMLVCRRRFGQEV